MAHAHLTDFTRRVFLSRTLQVLGAAAALPVATASSPAW